MIFGWPSKLYWKLILLGGLKVIVKNKEFEIQEGNPSDEHMSHVTHCEGMLTIISSNANNHSAGHHIFPIERHEKYLTVIYLRLHTSKFRL